MPETQEAPIAIANVEMNPMVSNYTAMIGGKFGTVDLAVAARMSTGPGPHGLHLASPLLTQLESRGQ